MKNNIQKIAIFALTQAGSEIAAKLAEKIPGSMVIIPEKLRGAIEVKDSMQFFAKGTFSQVLTEKWNKYSGHIFVMATGIVVRQIAKLLYDKTRDPAVVVCDEKGEYVISLLSGHIGGANRLAQFAAEILDGNAVITTATDVQGLMAFDEMAAVYGWGIANPAEIKVLNTMLLEGRKIAVFISDSIYSRHYATTHNIYHVNSMKEIANGQFEGAVVMTSCCSNYDENTPICDVEMLILYDAIE